MTHPVSRSAAVLFILPMLLGLDATCARAQQEARERETLTWLGAGAAFAGALLLDRTVDSMVPDGGGEGLQWLANPLNHLGRPQELVPAAAGVFLVGKLTGKDELSRTAVHAVAVLAAAGVANGAMKYTIGRQRPGVADDPWVFHPFSTENARQSFPSGHVVVVFSLAHTLASESGNRWVGAAVYSAAAAVGWSRMYEDKHWASDVVGGAIIGVVTSRATLRLLHRIDAHGSGAPATVTLLPNGVAVRIPVR